MQAPATVERRYYRPELDVVRFLAFSFVFLGHFLPRAPTPHLTGLLKGFAPVYYRSANACIFGVSLFFTLSAFLICELLLREKEATGTVQGKQFYLRRILRIWPLYYLVLALGMVAAFLPGGDPGSVTQIGWYAIFLGAWSTAHFGWINNPVFPLWSVSVEEQFYLLAPWVIKFLNRRLLYGFCVTVILVANASLIHLGRVRAGDDAVWCNVLVQFQCFAVGILLCLVLRGRLPRLAVWQRLSLLATGWLCWLFAVSHHLLGTASMNGAAQKLIEKYALVSLGSIMILLAFLGLNPKLIPRWAIHLGRISFGLYVFHSFSGNIIDAIFPKTSHNPPMFLLRICVAFILTVLFAELSYRFFETPFLQLKKRHAIIESQPV